MRSVAVLAWCLAACTAEPLFDELPSHLEDRALVVVVDRGGTRRFLTRDPTAPAPLPELSASDDAPLTLTVLGYRESLDALGLPVNAEISESLDPQRSRPLAPWDRALRRELRLDDDSGWITAEPAAVGALAAVRLAAAPVCRSYAARDLSLGVVGNVGVLAAFSDGDAHAMVAVDDPVRWLRFDARGFEMALDPVPGLSPLAATRSPDGAVFLTGARDGRYELWWRRAIGEPFRKLPASPAMEAGGPEEAPLWISSPDAGAVYVLAASGRLSALEDGAWRDLPMPVLGDPQPRLHGALLARARGELDVIQPFAFAQRDRHLTVIRGTSERTVTLQSAPLPYAVGHHPELGPPLYGGSDGRLYRLEGRAMELVAPSPLNTLPAQAVLPVRSGAHAGVLVVGGTGLAVELYATGDLCITGTGIDATRAVPLGSDVLVLGQRYAGQGPVNERTPAAVILVRGAP